MSATKKTLSIVTPVYNRARLMERVFGSLILQTNEEFEWIIIDDGSNDNIEEIVKGFLQKASFPILYLTQSNAGKCAALNYAFSKCDTELVMVLDSDDYLAENAVSQIIAFWRTVKKQKDCIGIASYKQQEDGKISGRLFDPTIKKTTLNRLNYHYRRHGELALAYKTELVRRHPFMVSKGEKFSSEEIQYNELDREGMLYLLNAVTMIMEYQPDGLTKNYWKLWMENPMATKMLLNSKYRHTLDLDPADVLIKKIKTIVQYDMLASRSSSFKLRQAPNKALAVCLYLPSALLANKMIG